MSLPCDTAHQERHQEVDRHPDQHRTDILADAPVHNQHRREQAEQRAGRAIGTTKPPGAIRPQRGPGHQPKTAAQTGKHVQREKRPMPHHLLQHRPHAPQRQHVEQDMQHRLRRMQKHRREEHPRLCDRRHRIEPAVIDHGCESKRPEQAEHHLDNPHGDARDDDRAGEHGAVRPPLILNRPLGEQVVRRRRTGEQTESAITHVIYCSGIASPRRTVKQHAPGSSCAPPAKQKHSRTQSPHFWN